MVTEQFKFFGVCVGLVILLIQQLHGKLTGTFSSTQRKCKDKQNLLFSTLGPLGQSSFFLTRSCTPEKLFFDNVRRC